MQPSRFSSRVYRHAVCIAALTLAACAATQPQPTTPRPGGVVQMDELRITAKRAEDGSFDFQSYDANELFERAMTLYRAEKWKPASELYDRLVAEFPNHRLASAAYYNAGLALQKSGDFAAAADRYQSLRDKLPGSADIKDASLQLSQVLIELQRWQPALQVSVALLAREELSVDERVEAMARKVQALSGAGDVAAAAVEARACLSYVRTRPEGFKPRDDFFAAACNFVLAETFRVEGQSLAFPEGLEPQKAVLIHRAELLLEAQREYWNTIGWNNVTDWHWAALSGYRIGNMYDELWQAIMSAPVPGNLPPEGHSIYHQELAKLIKPLIRHAIRYWEQTLLLAERAGIQSDWTQRTRADLVRVRALILEQPEGPGGLPAPGGAALEKRPDVRTGASWSRAAIPRR